MLSLICDPTRSKIIIQIDKHEAITTCAYQEGEKILKTGTKETLKRSIHFSD